MQLTQVTNVTMDNVLSVYSGKDGRCCCGCSGKHYYRSDRREEAGKDRGYEVDDDEVNDKMVRKVVKIINEAKRTDSGDNYVSTVIGSRLYIAYIG